MTRTPHRGYTLLEMIVSIGIFSIVMLIATAAYLTLISVDRQTRTTSDLMNNISFATDSMTRAIRTGSNYCVAGCTTNQFTFIDTEGRQITYTVNNGVITRKVGSGTAIGITDPRVSIDDSSGLRFYVWGENDGPADGQPRVTFIIKGSMTPDSNLDPIDFVVQGSATQRAIDI